MRLQRGVETRLVPIGRTRSERRAVADKIALNKECEDLVDQLDHQRLHFAIADQRQVVPGYLALGRDKFHISVAAGLACGRNAGLNILQLCIVNAALGQRDCSCLACSRPA